jgi:hypothetical protein
MEFEEMQKIWSVQNNEPLYAINVKALHNRILAKKQRGDHTTNFTELLVISANVASGAFILGITLFNTGSNIFIYLLAAWMFITGLYCMISRHRRIKGENKFDRSMLNDLDHAIATAAHQVRLSIIMRWNMLPISTLVLLAVWTSGKSSWISLLALIFFIATYFASGWELNLYKVRMRELEILRKKLRDDETTRK